MNLFERFYMRTRFAIPLSVFLVCLMGSVGRSGIVLRVDMDLLTPGIQSNVEKTAGSNVTAGLMFELTGSTSIGDYNFSVQFDTNELLFVSRSETPGTLPGLVESDNDLGRQVPLNGLLRRFDGSAFGGGSGPTGPFGPVKVGEVSFTVIAPVGGPTDNDIIAGIFELLPTPFDQFIDNGRIDITSQVTFFGGSVSIAIPEPASFMLLATSLLAMFRFRRRHLSN